ncbi:MAG: C45 family peptidase [Gemmataceae bacterium]|nr:C45 family peptidase [Gemmataceae bacterium]
MPRVEVVCEGNAFAMGVAQGQALRTKIRTAREELTRLEAFRLRQPWWLPFPAYCWIVERKARRLIAGWNNAAPEMLERLRGIATGAGLGESALALFNVLEAVLGNVTRSTACPAACSAVAVRGRRSATGRPIIAHNFDYLPVVQPFYILRDSRPTGRARSLDFTFAPLAGAVDGVNEHGLAIAYNYAFTTDAPAGPVPPISAAITDALERCRTVEEAVTRVAARPRWGAGLLMLADATGDIASLELSSTGSAVRRPAAGEDAIYHTNCFSTDAMLAIQIPWDAVYTDRAPKPLRGRRLHLSSERRNERFDANLAGDAALGPDDLARIMADHGPTGVADDFTPCVHGTYWHTTACLQLLPAMRSLRVAYATACQARYETFQLS